VRHEFDREVSVKNRHPPDLPALLGAPVAVDREQHPRLVACDFAEFRDPVEQRPGLAEFDFDGEWAAPDVVGFSGRFGAVRVRKP